VTPDARVLYSLPERLPGAVTGERRMPEKNPEGITRSRVG